MIHVALFHVTVMGLQSNSIQQRLPSNLDAIVKQSHKDASGDETSLELRDVRFAADFVCFQDSIHFDP